MDNRKKKEELINQMNEKLNEGYNFVDYFITIGVNPDIFLNSWLYETDISELNNKFKEKLKPIIINKFPDYDKKFLGIDDGIIYHCFPHGFRVVESNSQPEYKIFSILLDNNNYSIDFPFKYVICLKFYESINNYKKLFDVYNQLNGSNANNNEINESKITIISKNTNPFIKKYYIPKCICLISLYPYINEISKIIKSIYEYSLVGKQQIPLEKIINNLLIEVPTPPRGIYYIEYSLINEKIILKGNPMNDLNILNIEFDKLFTIFNINQILEIFRYLMLNTKIIIFSQDIKNLTPIILSLLSLLYPFKYPYTVVSVLHKEAYAIIDNITPVLVGINEKYSENFFKNFDIDINDFTLVINMDKQQLINLPKDYKKKLPQLPYKYKNELLNKINNYINTIKNNKKKKGVRESSKQLQYIILKYFLEFQIELVKDYSKYLNTDIYNQQNNNVNPFEKAFKLKKFLSSVSSDDEEFYEYFLNTQMFCNFIFKRMLPKDKNEQMDILYFEEKLLQAKNNSTKTIFLNSKSYIFNKKYKVQRPLSLSKEQIIFYSNLKQHLLNGIFINIINKNINNRSIAGVINYNNISSIDNNNYNNCSINIGDYRFPKDTTVDSIRTNFANIEEKPLFTYLIFPKLNNYFFFEKDIKFYLIDHSIIDEVKSIDYELLSKSHLNRVQIKTNEKNNYIYLLWVKMWISTFHYHDKQEQEYRFFQMLNVLDKINRHEMVVMNNLFLVLINNKANEDLLLLLYQKILSYQLIPSTYIFDTVRNLISKKIGRGNKIPNFNISKYLCKLFEKNTIDMKKKFRRRTLKSVYDSNILTEKINFIMNDYCGNCDKVIKINDFMKNLKKVNNEDLLWAKCPFCNFAYLPKLTIIFGNESNKNNNLNLNTSIVDNVVLYSPKTLNNNMFDNTKSYSNIDVDNFKVNYNPFFWNLIWFFKINNLSFDFFLPYADNIFFQHKEKIFSIFKVSFTKGDKNYNMKFPTDGNHSKKNIFHNIKISSNEINFSILNNNYSNKIKKKNRITIINYSLLGNKNQNMIKENISFIKQKNFIPPSIYNNYNSDFNTNFNSNNDTMNNGSYLNDVNNEHGNPNNSYISIVKVKPRNVKEISNSCNNISEGKKNKNRNINKSCGILKNLFKSEENDELKYNKNYFCNNKNIAKDKNYSNYKEPKDAEFNALDVIKRKLSSGEKEVSFYNQPNRLVYNEYIIKKNK